MANLDQAVRDFEAMKTKPDWKAWTEEERLLHLRSLLTKHKVSTKQFLDAMGAEEAQFAPPSGEEASAPPTLGLAPNIEINPDIARMAGGMAGGVAAGTLASPSVVGSVPSAVAGYMLGGELAGQGAELINQFVLGSEPISESPGERTVRAATNMMLDAMGGEGASNVLKWGKQWLKGKGHKIFLPEVGVSQEQLRQDYKRLGIKMEGALPSLSPKYARKVEAIHARPGGRGVIDTALNKTFDDIGRTAWSLVDNPGDVKTHYELGKALSDSFNESKLFRRENWNALYDMAFSKMPSKARMENAVIWLKDNPDVFVNVPSLARWRMVLRQQHGELSPPQMKSLLGAIHQVTGSPLMLASQGIDKGAIKRFRTVVQLDVHGAAELGEEGAVEALRQADNYYKYSQDVLETLDTILKGDNVQGAFRAVFDGMRDGPERLLAVKESIAPNLWKDLVTAKVLNLGDAPASQRGAGLLWNMNTFLTNWNNISPEAKDVLLGNAEIRNAWDGLARIASAWRASKKWGKGASPSVISYGVVLRSILVSGKWITAPLRYYHARLLTWAPYVNWLTKGAEIAQRNPNGMAVHIGRLAQLAERNPQYADDLQTFLAEYGAAVEKVRSPTL